MATTTKKPKRVRRPSATEIARASEVIAAAQTTGGKPTTATERARQWSGEGLGKLWQHLRKPGPTSLRTMYRHTFVPWYWGAGTAAAIAVQEAAAASAGGASAASLALVAAGSAGTATLAPRLLRTERGRSLDAHAADWGEREPGHTRLAAMTAATGATAVHALGLATGHDADTLALSAGAGLAAFLGVSARYFQYHRHHTTVRRGAAAPKAASTVDPDTVEAAELAPDVFGRLLQRWPVATKPGAALEGAELIDAAEQPYGGMARVKLTEQHNHASVTGNLDRVAAALRIPAAQLEFTADEPEDGEPDPAMMTLRVISSMIMRRPVPLDDGQPRVIVRDGKTLLRVGRYVDGDGEVYWLLYDGSSMWSGYVGGVTGSGKSSLSDAVFLGMLQTGCTYTIYLDPKGGQSSPRIAESAHWFVGGEPDDWSAVIDGLIAIIKARGKLLAYQGTSGFAPTPQFPGICLIFDEFYEVDKGASDLPQKVAWIARKGRSVGVTIMSLTQGYGLEDFGGEDAVRSNVGVANAFSLKLKANQGSIFARDFPNLPNPAHLPETEDKPQNKGLAVALKGRKSVLRTAWSPSGPTQALIATARAATIDHLDPYSADALDEGSGGLYGRRHDQAEEAAAATESEIEQRTARGRALIAGDAVRQPSARPAGTVQSAAADPAAAARSAGRTAPPDMPERVLVDLEAWRRGERGPAAEPESAASGAAAVAVLEALTTYGPLGTQALVDTLAGRPGCGGTAVKAAVADLAAADRIAKGASRKSPWRLL